MNLFRNPAQTANRADPSNTMPFGSGTCPVDPALAVSPTVVVVVVPPPVVLVVVSPPVVVEELAPRPAVVNGELYTCSWPLESTLPPRTATKVPATILVSKNSAFLWGNAPLKLNKYTSKALGVLPKAASSAAPNMFVVFME